jgi:hypothetical protein
MSMRFYRVTLERGDERRDVRVPSPTDVQAADAAAPLMKPGESIAGIEEVEDDGTQIADALPPKTQAEEFAAVTPGAAAVR